MPEGYRFLKYGRPMVAAAPLLLGLSAAPTPAHACTGSINDPVFCAQVLLQAVAGVAGFISVNLTGLPGTSPIPGTTPALDDDMDFTPIIVDDTYFVGDPDPGVVLAYTYPGASTGDAFYEEDPSNSRLNYTTSGTGGATTYPVTGVPVIQPAPGSTVPTTFPTQRGTYQHYGFDAHTYDTSAFQFVLEDGGTRIQMLSPDGKLPVEIQNLMDQADGSSSSGSGCSLDVPTCRSDVGQFFVTINTNIADPIDVPVILNAAVNGTPSTNSLQSGDALINGENADPQESAHLRTYYRTVERNPGPSTTTNTPSPEAEAGANAYVQRQVASITRLREEVENETDPAKRAEAQAELTRKENGIRQYGSAALRTALNLGDASTAPIPSRN